jgi:hypothetical protein
MLASIVQFSNNDRPPRHHAPTGPEKTSAVWAPAGTGTPETTTRPRHAPHARPGPGPFPQDPTTCPATRPPPAPFHATTPEDDRSTGHRRTIRPPTNQRSTHERPGAGHPPANRTLTTRTRNEPGNPGGRSAP